MYRFFDPVIRPLLDVARPAVVVEIGSDRGHGTKLLADWCHSNGATLHSIDPLPKFDVDEWTAKWPGTLICHRQLSLNALVDIEAADFVCIDGDHNWYTVFHELEILARSASEASRPFPLTLLHDVGWPYGRRDLYYDPDTIPGAFRHPHRKGGLVPEQRALAERGFNDHLENAIHEGTPRNGVRTAIEDFVSTVQRNLLVNYVPGIHGLGVIVDTTASEKLVHAVNELLETSSLMEILNATESDRLTRLLTISGLQRNLESSAKRLSDANAEVEATAAIVETLRETVDAQENLLREHKLKIEGYKRERDTLRVRLDSEIQVTQQLERSHADLERTRTDLAQQLDGALARNRELSLTSESQRKELIAAIARGDAAQRDLGRLRRRRSVRLALRVASLMRPFFRLRRGQFRNRRPRDRDRSTEQANDSYPEHVPSSSTEPDGRRLRVPVAKSEFTSLLREMAESPLPASFVEAWNRSLDDLPTPLNQPSGPLVSIIMPTFNRANIIGQAIQSALDQTYSNWELLVCDDASDDETQQAVAAFRDERIRYTLLPKGGAAAARNAGLRMARGEVIAYLDSDNIWHPRFLELTISRLQASPGRFSAYAKYIDVQVTGARYKVNKFDSIPFAFERLVVKNFIDLNVFVHRRYLYEHFGGFDERLQRQQDWALIIKYTYLRDPLYIDHFLMIYRRNDEWDQITKRFKHDRSSPSIVRSSLDDYYQNGLPRMNHRPVPSLSVMSWDVCRNHFAKAYNLAEAMAEITNVQLVGFRFFGSEVFAPYASTEASFDTWYQPGGSFPDWGVNLAKAVAGIRGDVVYAVKPRLPSLGTALLANYHFGKPIVLEYNDLESVVTSPRRGVAPSHVDLSDVDPGDPDLMNPYGQRWTQIMEGLAQRIPLRVTHNSVLDEYFGGGAFYIRNPKDEQFYDPTKYQREHIRRELGIEPGERVILFGGMVRRHKGIFEVAEAIDALGNEYSLLVVGSRDTPDMATLRDKAPDRVKIVPPVDRNRMAAINLACDAVVIWLDPDIPASHYQMPFKLTDALAMRVPVIANDIGDLGRLGRQGLLHLAPFADVEALQSTLSNIFGNRERTEAMLDSARGLYLRQFSYKAVQGTLALILDQAMTSPGTLEVAEDFARFFAEFASRRRIVSSASDLA